MSDILDTLYCELPISIPNLLWQESTLLGVSHRLFDIMFRTSLLRRRLPLIDSDRDKASRLKDELQDWHWSKTCDNSIATSDVEPPEGMLLTAALYRLACLLLVEKVMDTSIQSIHHIARAIVIQASQVICQIPADDLERSIHSWPLLILGFAAVTGWERALFSAPFEQAEGSLRFGHAAQAYDLLQRSWFSHDEAGQVLGLNTLLRDDLLCQIFI